MKKSLLYPLALAAAMGSFALAAAGAEIAGAGSSLPEWTCSGNETAIEAAAARYTASLGDDYLKPEGAVSVPAPVILRIGETEDRAEVLGNFWVFNYVPDGEVLSCVSGGEAPGVMTLAKEDGLWNAVSLERAGDGDSYYEDILRFSDGDAELEGLFLDSSGDALKDVRLRYLRAYVSDNGLKFTAYRDFGWDAVPLEAGSSPDSVLDELAGQSFVFSSGVGGWDTTLTFGEKGAFTGHFHDSEMGETGEGYPDGTVYGCLFHGRLDVSEKLSGTSYRLSVASLAADEGQAPEATEDGVRYVTSDPYGLHTAKELILYLPGTPVSSLPEAFLPWSHLSEIAPSADRLPCFALWNAEEDAGFIGDVIDTAAAQGVTVTARAVEIDPAHVAAVAVHARITAYSKEKGTLTAELIVPEEFNDADVASLRPGDSIYTQGRAVTVRTLERDPGFQTAVNKGAEDEVILYALSGGIWRIYDGDDNTWNVMKTAELPVTDALIFLDGIDPSDGGILDLPAVHTAAEFLDMLEKENGVPGFAANNVYAVFDADGALRVIQRYYVPWQ